MHVMATKKATKRAILLYAASEIDADMRYASRFLAPDPFVFVQTAAGRRHLMMSDLEIDRARAQSSAHRVHAITDYTQKARERFGKGSGLPETIATLLRALRIRSVTVPANFPLGLAESLRKRGVALSAAPGSCFPARLIKSPGEVDEIRRTMRATEAGMREAVKTLEASQIDGDYLIFEGRRLTSETLRSNINTTILARGYVPMNTIVAGGAQGCDPHERGRGPLRASSPIIVDIFPRSEASGYFGDITRTFVRGKASPFVRRMYQAVRAAQRLGLDAVRHGVNGRNIHDGITQLFEGRGFETGRKDGRMQGFFHSTGHGLGLDIHEPPRIGPVDAELQTGMVVTIEPGLYYIPHGGVRIEDTVLVTRRGIENLTRFPKKLEI